MSQSNVILLYFGYNSQEQQILNIACLLARSTLYYSYFSREKQDFTCNNSNEPIF